MKGYRAIGDDGQSGLKMAFESQRDDLSPEDLARVHKVTSPTSDFSRPEKFERLPAGIATSRKQINRNAFSNSLPNIAFAD